MNQASDAADQIVKMSLGTAEVAIKLTGEGAIKLATLIAAALRDPKKTKGKTRLINLLKSEKPLKVFSLPIKDLKQFCNSLYSVIIDQSSEEVHTHIVSVDCAWSQRAHSASINSFYCGYRGAMAIIDEVMPLPYGSTLNISKTITMEYRLGLIKSFSEQEELL